MADGSGTRYVTHSEFQSFRDELREEFSELRGDIKKMSGANWPQISVMVALIGMAAALIGFVVASEKDARITGDDYQTKLFAAAVDLRREVLDAERDVVSNGVAENTKDLDHLRSDFDAFMSGPGHGSLVERVSALERDASNLDTVLQREMRLLDEVLQREMGLHVSRLEDLIAVNTRHIEQIMANRFTSREGDRLETRVNNIESGGR